MHQSGQSKPAKNNSGKRKWIVIGIVAAIVLVSILGYMSRGRVGRSGPGLFDENAVPCPIQADEAVQKELKGKINRIELLKLAEKLPHKGNVSIGEAMDGPPDKLESYLMTLGKQLAEAENYLGAVEGLKLGMKLIKEEKYQQAAIYLEQAAAMCWGSFDDLDTKCLVFAALAYAKYSAETESIEPKKKRLAMHQYNTMTKRLQKDKTMWAINMAGMGDSYAALFKADPRPEYDRNAIASYEKALTSLPKTGLDGAWATTQYRFGNALMSRNPLKPSTIDAKEAIKHYNASLEVWTEKDNYGDWAISHLKIGQAFYAIGVNEKDMVQFQEALQAYDTVMHAYMTRNNGETLSLYNGYIGDTFLAMGRIGIGTQSLDEAIKYYSLGEEQYRKDGEPAEADKLNEKIKQARALIAQRRK